MIYAIVVVEFIRYNTSKLYYVAHCFVYHIIQSGLRRAVREYNIHEAEGVEIFSGATRPR